MAYVIGTGLISWNISEHNRQDLCPQGVHVLVEGGKTAQIRSHTHSNIKNSHNMLEDIHVKKKKEVVRVKFVLTVAIFKYDGKGKSH